MSDNVLNQLRNKRNRSTVEPRQDALVPKVQPQAEEQNSPQEPSPVTELPNPTATPADTISELTAELEKYPETRRHSAIVLEKDLDQELTRFCKDRGITVEVFLEAAWAIASADNALVEKITTEAKRRYDRRKRVGQIKRLITMLSNSSK
ncbi:MAG: hypothetical protein PUP90_01055 [Nostoc sp. S4]|nr:hypothetical protein [Nostoc sp. S4]